METNHGAPAITGSGLRQPYHLVDPSPWPIIGAFGGGCLLLGIVLAAHHMGYLVLIIGALMVATVMVMWWRSVLRESATPGMHSYVVRLGMRYAMMLFITSEVLFFVSFFWAFFSFALYPEHVLSIPPAAPDAAHVWPPAGVVTFNPFHLPLLNTMILLLSGTTVTWAHHALLENKRSELLLGLGLTVILGLLFTTCQAIEYADAPFKLNGGIYPAVFFIATGFHGFHVIVGTIFLAVCWFRAKNGAFTPERHFGFEAAAWYWHFVDVVWLFLFICVYFLWAAPVVSGG
jgi:cytochrome c oxidase subunit 3